MYNNIILKWKRGNKVKVALITSSFGFGPVSKLQYIAEELKKKAPSCVLDFYGSSIALEYIEKSKMINKTVEIDVDRNAEAAVEHLKEYDLVIDVMNMDILSYWKKEFPPIFLIDSLSWMWEKPPIAIGNAYKYYIQDYLLDDSKVNLYKKLVEVKTIPPITNKIVKNLDKKNQLLVNFSGMYNPFTNSEFHLEYSSIITNIVMELFEDKFDDIVITTNEKLAAILNERFDKKYKNLTIKFLEHDKFIDTLLESKIIFTNSGITTTIEALHANASVAFILPQNYSQALMSQMYYEKYGFKNSMPLNRFDESYYISDSIDEETGVNLVEGYVESILLEKQDLMRKYFLEFVEGGTEDFSEIMKINKSEFGQDAIVQDILNMF